MTNITRREAIALSVAAVTMLDAISASAAALATHCTLCGSQLPERRRLRELCPDFGLYPEDGYCARCLIELVKANDAFG